MLQIAEWQCMKAISFLGSSGCSSFRIVVGLEFASKVSCDRSSGLSEQASAAFDAERVNAAVLRANLWLLAILPVLHQLRHRLVSQILVEILVVYLDHRRVNAGA